MAGPLSHLRVLDMSMAAAGQVTSLLLHGPHGERANAMCEVSQAVVLDQIADAVGRQGT
jgi:hypothetical protein